MATTAFLAIDSGVGVETIDGSSWTTARQSPMRVEGGAAEGVDGPRGRSELSKNSFFKFLNTAKETPSNGGISNGKTNHIFNPSSTMPSFQTNGEVSEQFPLPCVRGFLNTTVCSSDGTPERSRQGTWRGK